MISFWYGLGVRIIAAKNADISKPYIFTMHDHALCIEQTDAVSPGFI